MGRENHEIPKREKGLPSLIFNILVPVLLLTQGNRLIANPAEVLLGALAFPVGYFIWDYRRRRKVNFISILGFVSIILTGGVGLLHLPRFWFIVKETAIPALLGVAIIGSLFTRYPLIRALVFSRELFDVDRIHAALKERCSEKAMERLLRVATLLLSLSFFLSAGLNLVLASHFVKTEPRVNAVQFNTEVGRMTGWSYAVIALPSMIFLIGIFYLVVHGIHKHAGLSLEQALSPHLREAEKGDS